MKKLVTALTALVLTLTVSTPAFADGGSVYGTHDVADTAISFGDVNLAIGVALIATGMAFLVLLSSYKLTKATN